MKKLTMFIMTAALVFVFTHMAAYAQSPKLSKAYVDAMKSGKYSMKYIAISNVGGMEMRTNGRMAVDGKNMATETEMPQMNMKMKNIIKGDKMYMVNDTAQTYQVMPYNPTPTQGGNQTGDYSKLEYLGSGTGTINGKTLPYEEYKNADAKTRYYFNGAALYAIESIVKDMKTVMIIEEFSHSAPADLFNIPQGYTQI